MTDSISSSSQASSDGGLASPQQTKENSFGEVVSFVERHSKLVVLTDENSGASIAVWPAMQGRVLTSSVAGANGLGYGWVNRELIASGKIAQHINAVGGEDRIWLGPKGGQFSIFFAPGVLYHGDVANTYNDGQRLRARDSLAISTS